MKPSILITVAVIGFSALTSCKKENKKIPDVYVSYMERTGLHSTLVKYSRNGSVSNLSNGNYEVNSSDIIVAGNDVYVSGYDYDGTTRNAVYWKNGDANFVSTSAYQSKANAIELDNNIVYTGGYEENSSEIKMATYWENNTATALTAGTYDAEVNDITFNGYLHLAGYTSIVPLKLQSIGKKPGPAIAPLSDGTKDEIATGVYTVGSFDVYISGYEKNGTNFRAKYWYNGDAVLLSDENKSTVATDICVFAGDIYVSGYEYVGGKTVAKYWKNGTEFVLSDGTEYAYAYKIVVFDYDVYVAGADKRLPVYWKNGVSVPADNVSDNGIANSIFIQP
jgi:hypothetical protein